MSGRNNWTVLIKFERAQASRPPCWPLGSGLRTVSVALLQTAAAAVDTAAATCYTHTHSDWWCIERHKSKQTHTLDKHTCEHTHTHTHVTFIEDAASSADSILNPSQILPNHQSVISDLQFVMSLSESSRNSDFRVNWEKSSYFVCSKILSDDGLNYKEKEHQIAIHISPP